MESGTIVFEELTRELDQITTVGVGQTTRERRKFCAFLFLSRKRVRIFVV